MFIHHKKNTPHRFMAKSAPGNVMRKLLVSALSGSNSHVNAQAQIGLAQDMLSRRAAHLGWNVQSLHLCWLRT